MEGYNVSELFNLAFGLKNFAVYKPSLQQPRQNDNISFKGIEVVEDENYAGRMSFMGTPIIFPVKFKGGEKRFYNSLGEIITYPVADFELPAATLVNFRRAKIISQTTALANKGTVKELYGFNDWSIDIRGICLHDPGRNESQTAYEQHKRLKEFDDIAESITVIGDLFADKDIGNIVIKEIDFRQVQGKPNIIPFSMRCVSDQPLELLF